MVVVFSGRYRAQSKKPNAHFRRGSGFIAPSYLRRTLSYLGFQLLMLLLSFWISLISSFMARRQAGEAGSARLRALKRLSRRARRDFSELRVWRQAYLSLISPGVRGVEWKAHEVPCSRRERQLKSLSTSVVAAYVTCATYHSTGAWSLWLDVQQSVPQ